MAMTTLPASPGSAAALRRDDPWRGARVLGLAEGVGLASGLALHVMAARWLGPADYGRFSSLLLVEIILIIVAASGIPQGLRHLVSLNPNNLAEALRWVARRQVFVGIALALLLSLGARPAANLMGDAALVAPLGLLGLDVAIQCGLMEPFLVLLNGARGYGAQALTMSSYFVVRVLGVSSAIALTGTLVGAVAGLILASVLATALGWRLLAARRRRLADAADPDFDARAFRWLRLAPAFEVLAYLFVASNLWLVEAIEPDRAIVGGYAACFMMALAAQALGRTLAGCTFAELAVLFDRGEEGRVARILSRCLRLLVLLAVPAVLVGVARGQGLVSLLFGARYRETGHLLGILLGAGFATAALSFFCNALAAAGRLRARLVILAFLVPSCLAATVAAHRLAGCEGAASMFLALAVVGASSAAKLVGDLVGPFVPWSSLPRIGLAGFVAGAASWGMSSRQPFGLAGDLGLFAIVDLGLLFLAGELAEWLPGRASGSAPADPVPAASST